MAFAIVLHLQLSELFNTPINVVLLIIAGSAAYGRFVMAPFWAPRGRAIRKRPDTPVRAEG